MFHLIGLTVSPEKKLNGFERTLWGGVTSLIKTDLEPNSGRGVDDREGRWDRRPFKSGLIPPKRSTISPTLENRKKDKIVNIR